MWVFKTTQKVGGDRKHTVGLFLDLEGDRLPGHLQEMDGLAQWLSFQADPVDGQDTVPDVYGPGPAGLAEQRRQKYQFILDSADGQAGEPVSLPVRRLGRTQRRFLLQKGRDSHCSPPCLWEKNTFQIGSRWFSSLQHDLKWHYLIK